MSKRTPSSELESGDKVEVSVNQRAKGHLGVGIFKAIIEENRFNSVVFRPLEQLQEGFDTHTWYSDIGYIHGYHSGLERYSDIGKVQSVRKLE